MLPESTVLGELTILEVYEFYIQPALFACRNVAEQIYLAVWVDEDEDSSRWLYVAVSLERFLQVRGGKLSLREAFAEPEDGVGLDVVVYSDPKLHSRVDAVPSAEIDESWLPLPGEYLEVDAAVPESVRLPAQIGHFRYSSRLPKQEFSLRFEARQWIGPRTRTYTSASKPLTRGAYDRLRREITRPRRNGADTWLAEDSEPVSSAPVVA